MGLVEQIEIDDEFYNVTTEEIVNRVLVQKEAIENKVGNKKRI